MKFRRLRKDELQELEAEFIRFLSANTVTGDDWERLKKEQSERADNLIDLFSDIVFEKILKKLEYLEFKAPKDIRTFHCEADRMVMFGLKVEGQSTIDFTQNQDPLQMIQSVQDSHSKVQLYRAEKTYSKERELELFEMMEQGCLISKGELFNTLKNISEQH